MVRQVFIVISLFAQNVMSINKYNSDSVPVSSEDNSAMACLLLICIAIVMTCGWDNDEMPSPSCEICGDSVLHSYADYECWSCDYHG
jgi:hypothetical protein